METDVSNEAHYKETLSELQGMSQGTSDNFAKDDNDEIYTKVVFKDAGQNLGNTAFGDTDRVDQTTEEESMNNAPPVLPNTQTTYSNYIIDPFDKKFPGYTIKYPESIWIRPNCRAKYFIRKQPRIEAPRSDASETDIALNELENLVLNDGKCSYYWFHATSWKSAKKKAQKGPKMSKGPLDMAYHGAFYLNPCYDDCYEWFSTKNSSFKGKHAMLIYKFDPENLNRNGRRLDDKGRWKTLAGERSKNSAPYKEDWIYTYQNSNANKIEKSGNNAKIRLMSNGKPAMQLI
ncbi:unnamed protein product [Adineta steineri]|uniref:Uncharacterized protein n=1 Tax=Adineta steineri TaxID=433720 RepID=A0A818IYU7_9BILA|nr:unnamed protein product [Adineta steineri]